MFVVFVAVVAFLCSDAQHAQGRAPQLRAQSLGENISSLFGALDVLYGDLRTIDELLPWATKVNFVRP